MNSTKSIPDDAVFNTSNVSDWTTSVVAPTCAHCGPHRLCAEGGGIGSEMPGAARGAKRRKLRVVEGDAAARAGDDEGESGNRANPLCALPLALQEHIASLLDHDSLFTSARVCKAWRGVVLSASPTPMRGMLKRIVEGNAHTLKHVDLNNSRLENKRPPEYDPHWMPMVADDTRVGNFEDYTREAVLADFDVDWMTSIGRKPPLELLVLARDRVRGDEDRNRDPASKKWSSRDVYRDLYRVSCYDCASLLERREDHDSWARVSEVEGITRTTAGALKVRLCKACQRGYAKSTPAQRLATGAAAKDFFLLRTADLQPLPCGIDTNPVDPGWAPMRVYRKTDATEAALTRWGDRASWEKERHKRLVGKV